MPVRQVCWCACSSVDVVSSLRRVVKVTLDTLNWPLPPAGGTLSEEAEAKSSPTTTLQCHTKTTPVGAVCVHVCMCEASSNPGYLPEHLSNSDPQCYSLWLLIIDRGTQTDRYAHSLYMLSCVPFTLMRHSPRRCAHSFLCSLIEATGTTSSASLPVETRVREFFTLAHRERETDTITKGRGLW